MREFVIYADSACDMSPEILAKWGVPYSSLTFRFDGEDKEYANGDMVSTEFYDRMRKGGVAKTAAVNSEMFREGFEKLALENKDILYLRTQHHGKQRAHCRKGGMRGASRMQNTYS